jgi:cytochrome c553
MRAAAWAASILLVSVVFADGSLQTSPDEFRIEGDAERGQKLFARSCSPCHGANGNGTGCVRIDEVEMPDLRDRVTMKSRSDWEIYAIIAEGGAVFDRCDTMLPAGERLDEQSLQDLAAYVKSLPVKEYIARQRRY